MIHPAAAEGFSKTSDDYERARPGYPPAAVERIGLGPGRTVVDVAAGTGKLTRLLIATGARVIAVEPIAEMRDKLPPDCEVVVGTAEDLPLPDASADAITVGQAMHWFDGPRALASFHRVLRPGGTLAVVYNHRDQQTAWVHAIDELVAPFRTGPNRDDGHWRQALQASDLFGDVQETVFDNPQELTPEEVVARYRSISFVGALGAAEQGELLASIAHVMASHPDTAGLTSLVIPQRTTVSICTRAG